VRRFSAVLTAGALLFAGCSSGGVSEEVSTSTLFPEVVETTTTPPTTVPDSPTPSTTTIPPPPTTTIDSPTPEPTPVGHALSFTPEVDSFSFENFGGGEAPADLTVNMARRLYGDDQVCSEVTDNRCTPYPVILQLISQANKSMRGGLCEGLAVLSLRLAGDLKTLASFQGTDTVSQLVQADPALLSEIAYWYVTQFAVEVQQEASSYLKMSPKELAEVLLYDFAESEAGNNHTGFTIGIYSEMGGHAVTPYRVSQTPTGYRIYIYDSNWPTAERWIDVDEDGWVYALAATNPTEEASAWSGGTGTMELTPMSVRGGPFTCGFCPQEGTAKSGTLLTVAASGSKQMSLKIVTESGQRLGYYDEGFVNEIPGATYRYLISGPSTADPVLVFLPPDVESFTADVEEIDVPAPEAVADATILGETPSPVPDGNGVEPPEQEQEEPTPQKFSLLVLNEEKSVQIEAAVVEPIAGEVAVEEEPQSLLSFSEESVQVAEIEEATVAISIDALSVEVELDEGQQIELVFAEAVSATEPEMLDLSIQDAQGEVLAEVAVDVSVYRVETTTPSSDEPDSPIPEPVMQPVQIEITYDEVLAEVVQEEEEIEAWVASDAEYFQAVAEDRLDEVLGETYVEEIEEIDDWEPLETDNDFDLVAVILSVDAEYWEDEQWEEVDYDEEWFEAEEEEFLEFFNEEIELEEVFEFVEEMEIDEYWEDDYWDEWSGEDEEQWILEEEGLEEWPEDWGPSPTESWEWEEEEWEEWEEEEFAEEWEDPTTWEEWEEEFLEVDEEEEWEDWEEEFWLDTEEEWDDWEDEFWPEDAEWCDDCEEGPWDEEEWEEPELEEDAEEDDGVEWEEPEPEIEEEQEVDEEEQETEEGDEEWPEDSPETEEEPTPEPVEEEPEPEEVTETEGDPWEEPPVEEPEPSWDPYEGCRDTSACADAPGGYETWEDYDQANNPGYYEDWGEVPEGFVNWTGFTEAVESGEVSAEAAGETLPDFVEVDAFVPPPPPVYVPTYTTASTTVALQETISSSSSTASTVATTTAESGILTHNSNDGHWHLDTTTATTVTTTHVDTTTVVARTGTDFVSCIYVDGVQSGCSTQRTWNDNETTVTAGDAYTSASTTNATVATEEGCAEGGWRGMGDWCIVQSSSRQDRDHIQFSLTEVTSVRIDAETNLTRAQFNTSNEAADPYLYLREDTDSDQGDHSGDTGSIAPGGTIETDDDGGSDCGSTCTNPPSSAVDVDETPTITYCDTGGACSDGVPVIDNVSDQWDARIVRTDMAVGNYVVQASVYNTTNSGWYRLTIEEVE